MTSIARRRAQLDKLIYQPKRLGILAALDEHITLAFSELQKITGITTGNLSVHIRRLEGRGLVSVDKVFVSGTSRTTITLEEEGRQAVTAYLEEASGIVCDWRGRQQDLTAGRWPF